MSYFPLLLLLAILTAPSFQQRWSSYSEIRTGQVNILSNAFQTTTSLPATFNATYTTPISNTLAKGIGIVGFDTYLTNYFSVNVTVTSFSLTHMIIAAVALDDTVIKTLTLNYIAVGTNTYFLDLQFSCFLPSIISNANNTRTETVTGATLFVNQALQCNAYLSGFRQYNSNGLLNYLSVQVTCPTNSYLTWTFTATQNNTVSLVCYTTVIFCNACTQITYLEWGQIGQDWLSPTVTPSSIAVANPQYQDTGTNGDDKTFWGMSAFNVSRGSTRLFNFQSNYYKTSGNPITTNYQFNSGTYNVLLAHFFIATRNCDNNSIPWFQMTAVNFASVSCVTTCVASTSYTLNATAKYCAPCHYTCLTCVYGALPGNCSSCDPALYRTDNSKVCTCNTGYIDVGVPMCGTCSSYITACTACVSTTVCTTCSAGFYIFSGLCQCSTGFLVTGVCTTIYGCISATSLGGIVYCLACNGTQYYTLTSNHTCVCQTAYYVDALFNCVGRCGDALLAATEQCDDGNVRDGDSCNSSCMIEADSKCDNSNMPSFCVYNYNVTATLAYVQRNLGSNSATFAFSLSPHSQYFPTLDYQFGMTTDLPCNNGAGTTIVGPAISHSNGYLMVNCAYTQSIEGKDYQFELLLDQFYWCTSCYINAKFSAKGLNAKLTHDSSYGLYSTQNAFVILAAIFALILMVLSMLTERMIGVECIQTFQSVLYAMTMMKVSPSSLAALQSLVYANGYNYLLGVDYARQYKVDFVMAEVGLQHQFLVSFNLSYIILGLIIGVCLALKAVMLKFEQDKAREQKQYNRQFSMEEIHPINKTIKSIYKIFFYRVYFLASFWCMFLALFAVVNQYILTDSATYVVAIQTNGFLSTVALVLILGFATIVILNGLYPKIKIFPMFMKPRYPVYYTMYNLLYIAIIICFHKQDLIGYILAMFTTINLIVLAIWRPYHQNLHNITLVFEQATILVAIGIYLFQSFTAQRQNNQSLFMIGFFVIVFLLIAVNILTLIRIYRFYHYMKDNKLSYDDPEDVQQDQERALVTPKGKQNGDAELDDPNNSKNKKSKDKGNRKFTPQQDSYYDSIKDNSKNPLNVSKQYKIGGGQQTKRNNNNQRQRKNNQDDEDYETFNRNKQKNVFQIDPIDPHPQIVRQTSGTSPYNQYGNIKLHNKTGNDEEYDALKAIKARLRKDFYQKVHGTEHAPSKQQDNAENSIGDTPGHQQPSDLHDEQ